MSFDTIVQLLVAIFTGKGEAAAAIASDPRFLLVLFVATLLAILPILVRQGKYGAAIVVFVMAGGLATVYWGARDTNFIVEPGKVFIGGDIASPGQRQSKVSLEGCKQICAADARCVAFTWDQMIGHCYPKAAIISAHPLASAISGIKQGPPMQSPRRYAQ